MPSANCFSCERESPNENHGWMCTRGPMCVDKIKNISQPYTKQSYSQPFIAPVERPNTMPSWEELMARVEAAEKERDEARRTLTIAEEFTLKQIAENERLTAALSARDAALKQAREAMISTADKVIAQAEVTAKISLGIAPRTLPYYPTTIEVSLSHFHDIARDARAAIRAIDKVIE